jgi:hypothetical protein
MGILVPNEKSPRVSVKNVIPLAKNIADVFQNKPWDGRRCLIVGGGSSLELVPPSIVSGELSIGINKSFQKFNTKINYSMDSQFYELINKTVEYTSDPEQYKLQEDWKIYKGIKIFLRLNKIYKFDPSVYYIDSLTDKKVSYDLQRGIYPGNNSGIGAIMLAVALGARKMGLLGFDMTFPKGTTKTHWHNGYRNQNIHTFQDKLDKFNTLICELAPLIYAENVKVYNLNLNSALNCFKKITVEEFIKEC